MSQLGFGDYTLPAALAKLRPRYEGSGGTTAARGGTRYSLVQGDAIDVMNRLPEACADLVFADPPYRLSNGGSSVSGGERVAVDKGDWDQARGLYHDHAFDLAWLRAARRILKPSGTLWVSGTQHNIFSVGFALQEIGFALLNTVTWFKPNAAPNLSCRMLTHSTELLLWAAPAALEPMPHVYNYDELRENAGGVQMRDMWSMPPPSDAEKLHGRHPTQKPLALLDRVVRACTVRNGFVVDPFSGSGTTGVVAVSLGRRYLGVDLEAKYLDLAARRMGHPDAMPAPTEEA